MHALVWNGSELKFDSSHPAPLTDNENALVRVRLAGICSTDLQIMKGYMDFHGVLGHEFVGRVEAGPATMVGKRVVGEINYACGRCEWCRNGLGRHCPERRVMGILGTDGCFAEFVAVPQRNLHVVPEGVTDEEAVFTEPLAAAFEILEQVRVESGHRAVVFGDGKLGLLCAQVLRQTGARVRLVGRHGRNLAMLDDVGVEGIELSRWHPDGADVVVEATGSPAGLELAMKAVRPRGTVVLKSTIAEAHRLTLAPLVIDEITVVGSRCGLFPPALVALEKKQVRVAPLIERTYPLEEGPRAMTQAGSSGALKVLLCARA